MNRLNKTESAVSLYYRFFLFLKDPFSKLFRGRNSWCCFCVEYVKLLPVHQYSVDIFHISVLQKLYWILTVLGDLLIVALSISSHEQTQLN